MEKIGGFAARFPKTVIALTLAITAGALALLPGMWMDANPYPLNPAHPSMVAYRELKTDFTGTLETGLIHLRHPRTIFNAATMERVARLTGEIEAISLVSASDEESLRGFVSRVPAEQGRLIESILAGGVGASDDFELLELTEWLESHSAAAPGLAEAVEELKLKLNPIKEVTSLANVENITSVGDELVVGRVFETVPKNTEQWEGLRAAVRSN